MYRCFPSVLGANVGLNSEIDSSIKMNYQVRPGCRVKFCLAFTNSEAMFGSNNKRADV